MVFAFMFWVLAVSRPQHQEIFRAQSAAGVEPIFESYLLASNFDLPCPTTLGDTRGQAGGIHGIGKCGIMKITLFTLVILKWKTLTYIRFPYSFSCFHVNVFISQTPEVFFFEQKLQWCFSPINSHQRKTPGVFLRIVRWYWNSTTLTDADLRCGALL